MFLWDGVIEKCWGIICVDLSDFQKRAAKGVVPYGERQFQTY